MQLELVGFASVFFIWGADLFWDLVLSDFFGIVFGDFFSEFLK